MLPQWEAWRKEDHWGPSKFSCPTSHHYAAYHTVTKRKGRQHLHPFECPHYIYFPLLAKHFIRKLNVFMRSLPKRTTKRLKDYNSFLYFKELLGTAEGARHTQFPSLHQWENLLSNSFHVLPAQTRAAIARELPPHPCGPASHSGFLQVALEEEVPLLSSLISCPTSRSPCRPYLSPFLSPFSLLFIHLLFY